MVPASVSLPIRLVKIIPLSTTRRGIGVPLTNSGITSGRLFAIAADGEKVMLTENGATSARPILSYYKKRTSPDNTELSAFFQTWDGNMAWLP